MYILMSQYREGDFEELDEAETRKEARELASEYRLAFGSEFTISIHKSWSYGFERIW